MIPRVFHRVWLGPPMPDEFRDFGQTWVDRNHGWELREWGEDDLDWIINRSLWDAAPDLMPTRLVHRFRSNIARVEILHREGGVYVDCDFEALAPLEPHIEGVDCFGVEERPGLLASGIIGARPLHPLLGNVIAEMPDSVRRRPGQPSWKSNGQKHLQRVAQRHGGMTLLPTELFYPYHHHGFSHDGHNPHGVPDGAVAHHVWASRRKSVSVVVPWRDPDEHRRRAWGWLRLRLDRSWQVVEASDGLDGPFSRSRAIRSGVAASFGDVVVISDADVWCDQLPQAISAVRKGIKWAVPHGRVHRLTEKATARVLAGESPDVFLGDRTAHDEKPYRGHETGGLVVMQRRVFEKVPPDARFVGWGGEDDAWGPALNTLVGPPWRGDAPLWHLWHPPQPRKSRSIGSEEAWDLAKRYRAARWDEQKMRDLVDAGGM